MEETVGWKRLRAVTFNMQDLNAPYPQMIAFSTSTDQPILKVRILRLWNPALSSINAAIMIRSLAVEDDLSTRASWILSP